MNDKQILDKVSRVINHWRNGSIKYGNMNYQLRYNTMINLGFLYINGVDANLPDLLSPKSKNTFIQDFLGNYTKICEQTRTDLKELSFIVKAQLELAEFTIKSANRKHLTVNNN